MNGSDAKRLIGRMFSDTTVQCYMKVWPFKIIEGESDIPWWQSHTRVMRNCLLNKYFLLLVKMKEVDNAYFNTDVKSAVVAE